jgi:hypothetical protein
MKPRAPISSSQPTIGQSSALEADEGGFRMSATASVALPGRSVSQPPQHIRALERANRVRLAEAETMQVCDLLLSQRRWGHQRARKVLSAIPISENKELGSLTERQRLALAQKLGRTVP